MMQDQSLGEATVPTGCSSIRARDTRNLVSIYPADVAAGPATGIRLLPHEGWIISLVRDAVTVQLSWLTRSRHILVVGVPELDHFAWPRERGLH